MTACRCSHGFSCHVCEGCRDHHEPDCPLDKPATGGTKPIREWPVRIGGLMRCCTETLRVNPGYAKEGQALDCFYCSSSMRLRDGAWEWNRD